MVDTAERPLRFCDFCGGLDSDPRHMRELGNGENSEDGRPSDEALAEFNTEGAPLFAIERLLSSSMSEHHHDCGAANGCEYCTDYVKNVSKLTGDKLVKHLEEVRNA